MKLNTKRRRMKGRREIKWSRKKDTKKKGRGGGGGETHTLWLKFHSSTLVAVMQANIVLCVGHQSISSTASLSAVTPFLSSDFCSNNTTQHNTQVSKY